jgi:hypothetical protein
MEGGGSYANFRTILKRIREEIRKDDNKAASGFMQFSTTFNWKFENIIKSLDLVDAKKTTTQDNMTNMNESEISDEDFTEGEETPTANDNEYSEEDYNNDKKSDEEIAYEIILERLDELKAYSIENILAVFEEIIKEFYGNDNDDPFIYIEQNTLFLLVQKALLTLFEKGYITRDVFSELTNSINKIFNNYNNENSQN